MSLDITNYNKTYYEQNKEKIKEYYKTKVTCEICGAVYARSSASHHLRTKKHQDAVDNIHRKYKALKKKYMKLKYAADEE